MVVASDRTSLDMSPFGSTSITFQTRHGRDRGGVLVGRVWRWDTRCGGTLPPMAIKASDGDRIVASNRRARRNYEILDTFECGIVLTGSEVKSLREATVQLRDAFARVEQNELWLINVTISPWMHASTQGGHLPERRRKLLMHRAQIDRLGSKVDRENLSLIPLSIYFKNGRAKVELALARGRRAYDKRQAIAKRDADLEARRAMHRRR